jgi:hypothetical protein
MAIVDCGFSSDWGDVGAATLCPGGHELTVRQVQISGRCPAHQTAAFQRSMRLAAAVQRSVHLAAAVQGSVHITAAIQRSVHLAAAVQRSLHLIAAV